MEPRTDRLTLRRPRSSPPLGFRGLKDMRLDELPILNLFYRFASAAWGNGYAAEAAGAVVEWAATHRPGFDGLDWIYVAPGVRMR